MNLTRYESNVEIGSPAWMGMITPSKVAAILAVSRWESQFSLWHRMKGTIPGEEPKDKFMVGHAMELAAAEMYRETHEGWRVSPKGVQFTVEGLGFPALVSLDRRVVRGAGATIKRRVLEVKITGSIEDWGDDYSDVAPADYLVQVTAQMGFSGFTEYPAHLMVLGPRIHQRHIYEIEFNPEVWAWILDDCSRFWTSLQGDTPPPLDNHKATYEAVRELHPSIDRGVETQVDRDLILSFRHARAEVARWEETLLGHKTKLLDQMGNSHYAKVGDVRVADRRNHGRGGVALVVNDNLLPEPAGGPG